MKTTISPIQKRQLIAVASCFRAATPLFREFLSTPPSYGPLCPCCRRDYNHTGCDCRKSLGLPSRCDCRQYLDADCHEAIDGVGFFNEWLQLRYQVLPDRRLLTAMHAATPAVQPRDRRDRQGPPEDLLAARAALWLVQGTDVLNNLLVGWKGRAPRDLATCARAMDSIARAVDGQVVCTLASLDATAAEAVVREFVHHADRFPTPRPRRKTAALATCAG